MRELLENQSRKKLSKPLLEGEGENSREQHKSLWNFLFRPSFIGKDLLTIEKFGLVQYVSNLLCFLCCWFVLFSFFWVFGSNVCFLAQMILKTLCAFLAFLLELFGVYGDGEFKWYYGYVSQPFHVN